MSGGRQLLETLKRLHYPRSHDLQPEALDWMFENDAVAPFLDWFIGNVGPANVLSSQKLSDFEALQASGEGILEGEELDKALRSSTAAAADQDDCSEDKLKDDIAALEEELQRAQKNRNMLLQFRNKLSLHHTAMTHKLTKLGPVEADTSGHYKASLEKAQMDNLKVNESLENLNTVIAELATLFQQSQDPQHAPFLSQQPLHSVHKSEETFTQALKQFTKKQFFEGIAELAGHNEGSRYKLLDMSDPRTLVIRGENAHVKDADCKELARLKDLYPTSQRGYMKALVGESRLAAAHRLAEKRLESLAHQAYPRDVASLSEKLHQCEQQKASFLAQATAVWEEEIPRLLEVNALLQATHILSGDYNLKIARQDYFTSKQDLLIEWLTTQRARKEFLDMAYEVESHHHRSTHRLLTASAKLLDQDLVSHQQCMSLLTDPDLVVNRTARSTVDGRDTTIHRLHSIIHQDQPEEKEQLFLTYTQLLEDSRAFADRLKTLRETLRSTSQGQEGRLAILEENVRLCENMVYAGSTTKDGQPVLTPPAILNGITQLDSTLETLTQSMLDLMGEYNSKTKILQADPLLARQRQLFVYFFTEPSRLRREVQSLNQQLQALRIS